MPTPLQMATTKRDGYANDATWIVCLHLENDRNAQYHFKNVLPHMKLMTQERVHHDVQLWLSSWFTHDAAGYTEVAQKIIDGWLGNIVDWLDWPQIVALFLDPTKTLPQIQQDLHPYTYDVVQELINTVHKKRFILEIEGYTAQVEELQRELRSFLHLYQSEPRAWKRTPLVQRIYDEYLATVNWQQVYNDLIQE